MNFLCPVRLRLVCGGNQNNSFRLFQKTPDLFSRGLNRNWVPRGAASTQTSKRECGPRIEYSEIVYDKRYYSSWYTLFCSGVFCSIVVNTLFGVVCCGKHTEISRKFTSVTSVFCTWLYLAVLGCTGLYWAVLGCFEVNGALLNYTGLYWVVLGCTGLYWTVLSCTWLYWAVLGCIGMYWAILGCTGQSWAVLGCTGLYWAVLGNTWLYWAVLGNTWLYWAVLGCSGLYLAVLGRPGLYWTALGCTGLYWAVLGSTGLYWAVLGCNELYCTVLRCASYSWINSSRKLGIWQRINMEGPIHIAHIQGKLVYEGSFKGKKTTFLCCFLFYSRKLIKPAR